MADMEKKRNVYTILFFLEILFIAIGFERNGALEGLAIRQAAYAETWSLSCEKPDMSTAVKDYVESLKKIYSCTKLSFYCKIPINGVLSSPTLTVKLSCSSAANIYSFKNLCIDYINKLCNPSTKTSSFRSSIR